MPRALPFIQQPTTKTVLILNGSLVNRVILRIWKYDGVSFGGFPHYFLNDPLWDPIGLGFSKPHKEV